ncbi:cytochrome P450 3A7 [Trichonephila clavipes]|nr:cytochrome P450 3A7 [Trichonephila clavipes]
MLTHLVNFSPSRSEDIPFTLSMSGVSKTARAGTVVMVQGQSSYFIVFPEKYAPLVTDKQFRNRFLKLSVSVTPLDSEHSLCLDFLLESSIERKEPTKIPYWRSRGDFSKNASEYFDEEFCREFLNTIIEERERKEKIELDERKRKEIELDERKRKEERELAERKRKEEMELAERKRKEEMELAERKRKEEMEIAERKRRADFEQKMRDMEMEFETQKKLIELEGEGHLARACLDIEVSTNRGNIGNEVRSNLSSETRLKVEVEDRLKAYEEVKAVEEGRKMEEERRMNEIIALEEEMRLKNEKWLVEEQMRHVQEKHETSMKEQKCLPEERCKRMNEQNQLLNEEEEKFSDEDMEVTQAIEKVLVSKGEQIQTRSTDQYAVAQSVVVEREKEEISVDVIKDKDESNPVILSKERIDFDEDEIEEEKLKLPKRKRKNLSSRTVAELQQKVNLKASRNMVLIPQHWSLRREYSQDKSGIGKLAWKLSDFIKRDGTVRIRRSLRENRSTRKRVRLKLRPQDNIYLDGKALATGDRIVDNMVSVVNGENWKRIRTIITPTFTTGKIKRMVSIFKECADTCIQNFKNASKNGAPVELKAIYGAFSMDVIASSAFSTKLDSHNDPKNQFVMTARRVFRINFSWRLIMFLLFPNLVKRLGISIFPPKATGFFRDATLRIIEERRRTGQTRNDFLQLLMDTAKEVSEDPKSELDLKETDDTAAVYGDVNTNHQVFKSVTKKSNLKTYILFLFCS